MRYWRGQGIKVVLYLDDGIGAAKGAAESAKASAVVQDTLNMAGFVAHTGKSHWTPASVLPWLGFVIDLGKGEISIPQAKIDALKHKLTSAFQCNKIPAKALASVIGKIISMGLGVGPQFPVL